MVDDDDETEIRKENNILSGYVLEVRDVSLNDEWAKAHADEIPVLFVGGDGVADDTETASRVRRPTPKVSAERLKLDLEKHVLQKGKTKVSNRDSDDGGSGGGGGWSVISDKPF